MRQPCLEIAESLTRRVVLGGLAASAAVRTSRAAIVNLVAVGNDGWLFPIWDEVRHTDLKWVGTVAELLRSAVNVLKQAKVEVVFALTPTKSRTYREMLPDDFKFSPDADRHYGRALEEFQRAGGFVADLLPPLMAYRTANVNEPVFFKGDTHWTPAGAQAAATELVFRLKHMMQVAGQVWPGWRLRRLSTRMALGFCCARRGIA